MVSESFHHLHVHSEYSLCDGAIRTKDLVEKAVKFKHSAVALTDHNNLYAAVDFYEKALKAGVKPIIGSEITLENRESKQSYNLVLLCKNQLGYKNLLKIVSSFYQDPTPNTLIKIEEWLKGLVVVSSQHRGFLTQNMSSMDSCLQFYHRLEALTDPESVYMEICDNLLEHQGILNEQIVDFSEKNSLPVVATANAHYLNEDDHEAHSILLGIKNDLTEDKMQNKLRKYDFSLFDPDTFLSRYQSWPEAIKNTIHISDQCNLEIETGKFHLPKFEISGETSTESLTRISREGLEDRLDLLHRKLESGVTDEMHAVYEKRLEYEISVIDKMGFPGYFLIVSDFIIWAKSQGIPVGPGRGSGAGSLVAYAMKITDIDPIPYNLLFERFLNPERISMPDFDVDFCQSRRDEVIQYVIEKYGKDRVAQITTFGKMQAKAVIRDVGRVMGMSYPRVDQIARLIPNELGITLAGAYEKEPRLVEACQNNQDVDRLFGIARKLEGLVRHTSVHAAGIVISDGPMTDYVPVHVDQNNPDTPITQYEMSNAEKVGLVKFDFLGLKTLTVIDTAVKLIKKVRGEDLDIELIPMDSQPVFKNVSAGTTTGIFQLEGSGMRNLLVKLKPSSFEDIIAVVALFRPGPLGSGMVDDFIERKHGRQKIEYVVPELEPILNETYGIILFQEQVQNIAASLASYSLGEADILRRAMGKKKPEEMQRQKVRFVDGCLENQIDEAVSSQLFDLMAKFAEYGFNKSHSAAYGLLSYQTAYLKTHYTVEFMAAILTCDLDNTEKVIRYVKDLTRMGITIHGPNINKSELGFKVENSKAITYGFSALKGFGAQVGEQIVKDREQNGAFTSFLDMANRIDLHKVGKKNLELLVQAGAFDAFLGSREQQFLFIPKLVKYSQNIHAAKQSGQGSLFDSAASEEVLDDCEGYQLLSVRPEHKSVNLDDLVKERKIMGVYMTKHPMELFKSLSKKMGNHKIEQLENTSAKFVKICGVVTAVSEQRIKKSGKRLLYITLEDETGYVETVMYEDHIPEILPPLDVPMLVTMQIKKRFDGQGTTKSITGIEDLVQLSQQTVRKLKFSIDLANEEHSSRIIAKVKELTKSVEAGKKIPVEFDLHLQKARILLNEKSEAQLTIPVVKMDELTRMMISSNKVKAIYGS